MLDFFRSAPKPKRILMLVTLATCCLLVLCTVMIPIAQAIDNAQPNPGPNDNNPSGNNPPQGSSVSYTTMPVASSDVYTKGSLLIVSTTVKIQTYPDVDQLVTLTGVNKPYETRAGLTLRLRSEAFDAFEDMMTAYHAATNDGSVTVTAAFRDEADQAALSSSAVQAGYSDHHLALSVALKKDGAELPAGHWIYENGYRYGYVQRYPAGKEASTGDTQRYYNCVRYVGIPHATYMHNNDLSLEEYVNAVKAYTYDKEHLTITAEGATYEVFYVPANVSGADAVTTLPVPADAAAHPYTYSGNNTDGFIVTVRVS